jgi:hypothetical protein
MLFSYSNERNTCCCRCAAKPFRSDCVVPVLLYEGCAESQTSQLTYFYTVLLFPTSKTPKSSPTLKWLQIGLAVKAGLSSYTISGNGRLRLKIETRVEIKRSSCGTRCRRRPIGMSRGAVTRSSTQKSISRTFVGNRCKLRNLLHNREERRDRPDMDSYFRVVYSANLW